MHSLLVARDVSKKYDSFMALSPTSLILNEGTITVLSGSNGSGKTTLLSCLSGIIRPTSGTVTVAGYDLYNDETEVRRHLAYVPDVPRFYLELTAWEHLRFIAMANQAMGNFDQRAEALMRKLDLWDARYLYPHYFSRGMRLKLGLVLALIRPFDVLLLDEPTSALDMNAVDLLMEELLRLSAQGAAILLSTHSKTILNQLAGHHILMQHGVIEAA